MTMTVVRIQVQTKRKVRRAVSDRYAVLAVETRPGKTAEPFAVVTEGRFPK